jgi:hypothetical protein
MLLAKHASKTRGSNKESSSSPLASPRIEPSAATPRGEIAPTPGDIGRIPMNADIFTKSNKFLEDPSRLTTTSQLEAREVRQLEAIVDTLEPEDGKHILAQFDPNMVKSQSFNELVNSQSFMGDS